MPKKRKKSFFEEFIESFFGDFPEIPLDMEGGVAGYSIEVHTTPEGTEVRAQVYGDTDKEELKKRLERMYPGAKIIIEGAEEEISERKPLIRRIDEAREEVKEIEEKPKVTIVFDRGKPIIRRIGSEEIKIESRERISEERSERKEKSGVRIVFRDGKPIIKRLNEED